MRKGKSLLLETCPIIASRAAYLRYMKNYTLLNALDVHLTSGVGSEIKLMKDQAMVKALGAMLSRTGSGMEIVLW